MNKEIGRLDAGNTENNNRNCATNKNNFGIKFIINCKEMDDELQKRYEIVEKLTTLFKFERMIHLIVTTVSLIILLVTITILLIKGSAGTAELTLMFGSSGLITYSAGRLLRMWDQALKIIIKGKID